MDGIKNLLDLVKIHYKNEIDENNSNGINGSCIVCGNFVNDGFKAKLKPTFTSGEFLQNGDCICPTCNFVMNNPIFRRKNWIINEKEFRTLKNTEIIQFLVNPLDPPFAFYLTRTYKKHGWLLLVNRINFSRKMYFLAMDYRLLFVDKDKIKRFNEKVTYLLEKGISKSSLLSGKLKLHEFRNLENKAKEIMKFLERVAGQVEWELAILYTYKKKKR